MRTETNHEVGKLINYFENYINDLNKDFTLLSKSIQQIRTTSQNTSHLTVSNNDTPRPISTTLPPIIDEEESHPIEPDQTFSEDIYDRLTYQTLVHTNSYSSREHLSVKSTKRRCHQTTKKRLHRRRAPTYIKELKAYLAHRESSINDMVKISDVKRFSNVLVWLSNQATSPSLIETSAPISLIKNDNPTVPQCKDQPFNNYLTYDNIRWKLKVRKEVFSPAETFNQPLLIELLYRQIIRDIFSSVCVRISEAERTNMKSFLSSHGVAMISDINLIKTSLTKKAIIEQARQWSIYFARLFPLRTTSNDLHLLGVSHSGIRLIKQSRSATSTSILKVMDTFPFDVIQNVSSIRNGSSIEIELTKKSIIVQSDRIHKIKQMIDKFLIESRMEMNRLSRTSNHKSLSTPLSNPSDGFKSSTQASLMTYSQTMSEIQQSPSFDVSTPKSTLPTGHSMMEFALQNFKLQNKKRSKKNWSTSEWTWQEYADLIKWSKIPIQTPLLRHSTNGSLRISRQCFLAIMRFMGDYTMIRGQANTDCLLYLLKNMYKHRILIDEVLCQILKQLTDNQSHVGDSIRNGWTLLAIVLNYFVPSDHLKPYFMKYLQEHYHQNGKLIQLCRNHYEQTTKYGGRKTMPNKSEFDLYTTTDQNRGKHQTFLLPGGVPLIILIKPSMVIANCLKLLCEHLNISDELENTEYSIFIISDTKNISRLLTPAEYIFDVLNECIRSNLTDFHLIIKRMLWVTIPFVLTSDTHSEMFINFMYHQLVPELTDGKMILLFNNHLSDELMQEIALLGALQYRASNKSGVPSMREVKYLLPTTVLKLKTIHPQQWTTAVHEKLYSSVESMSLIEAKMAFLNLIQTWPLFGVTFFTAQSVNDSLIRSPCFIGINKHGLLFLDLDTRETMRTIVYNDLISIRRYQTVIDIKYGNLDELHVIQCQIDKAQELIALSGRYLNFIGRNLTSPFESDATQIPTPTDTNPI
ncbi:unnamed protein product [Adineta ricciae]|uniref:MyTH4 domain-containing protein n=1 Tax=Adineta ricciae TaxID=249248 RepID=A0A813VIL7_ADIRI|nr:unnamed protein product [Adineta ricciae]CAF1338133.1 unnamed protein product [Adineta ricciae]